MESQLVPVKQNEQTSKSSRPRRDFDVDRFVVNTVVSLRAKIRTPRITKQVTSVCETFMASKTGAILAGQTHESSELFAGLTAEFPSNWRPQVFARCGLLLQHLDRAVEIGVASLRDELNFRASHVDSLLSSLADAKSEEEQMGFPDFDLPTSDEVERSLLGTENAKIVHSQLARMRLELAATFGVAIGLVTLESVLAFLTLEPLFNTGTSSAALLYCQAVAVSAVLIWLGHAARYSEALTNRFVAIMMLTALSAVLGGLRLFVAPSSDTLDPLITAIAALMTIAAFGFSFLAAGQLNRCRELIDEETAFRSRNAVQLAHSAATLKARTTNDKNAAIRRRLEAARRRTLSGRVHQLESRILGENVATRRLIQREVGTQLRRLQPEIRCAARQLARWSAESERA